MGDWDSLRFVIWAHPRRWHRSLFFVNLGKIINLRFWSKKNRQADTEPPIAISNAKILSSSHCFRVPPVWSSIQPRHSKRLGTPFPSGSIDDQILRGDSTHEKRRKKNDPWCTGKQPRILFQLSEWWWHGIDDLNSLLPTTKCQNFGRF